MSLTITYLHLKPYKLLILLQEPNLSFISLSLKKMFTVMVTLPISKVKIKLILYAISYKHIDGAGISNYGLIFGEREN